MHNNIIMCIFQFCDNIISYVPDLISVLDEMFGRKLDEMFGRKLDDTGKKLDKFALESTYISTYMHC